MGTRERVAALLGIDREPREVGDPLHDFQPFAVAQLAASIGTPRPPAVSSAASGRRFTSSAARAARRTG